MRLYAQIRQMVSEMIEGLRPEVLYGTVTSESPFIIYINPKLQLPREALVIGERFDQDIYNGDRKIIRKLELGDRVIILKLDEEYVVFDRVGES